MEASQSLPIPGANNLQPITTIDTQPWDDNKVKQTAISRRRRRSSGDVSPRLVFAALRILLEHICDDEICAKRLYRCLQKKLEKFFISEYTPKYDVTLLLTQELDRVICEIARRENIEIHLERCNRCQKTSLVPRTVSAQAKPVLSHNFKQNYRLIKILGEGGFGKVYHVRHEIDMMEYAVKEIPLKPVTKESGSRDDDKINREVIILAQLDHVNVVRYFFAWLEASNQHEAYHPQRIASIEFQANTPSENSNSSVDQEPPEESGLVIEEMSPRSHRPSPVLMENPLALGRELRSSDFKRSGDAGWSEAWTNDDEQDEEEEEEEVAEVNGPTYCSSSSDSPGLNGRSQKPNSDEIRIPTSHGDVPERSKSFPTALSSPQGRMVPYHEGPRFFRRSIDVPRPRFRSVLYIQMQLCDTSLKEWLLSRNEKISAGEVGRLDRKTNLNIFEQMVRGLRYIHDRNMIHRDIKPANILLVFNADGSMVVKLADFGLTTFVMDCACNEPNAESPRRLSSRIGTRFYAAPEQRGGGNYGQQADLYSLGLILFELFQPYRTETELMLITDGLRKDPVSIPPDFRGRWPDVAECVADLVNKDPSKRPSAAEILNNRSLLSNWRSLKTENDSLRHRVEFLELENRNLKEQLEKQLHSSCVSK